jgi:hypothetical protein
MTPERSAALAARFEEAARRSPRWYDVRVALLRAIGIDLPLATIIVVIGLCVLLMRSRTSPASSEN